MRAVVSGTRRVQTAVTLGLSWTYVASMAVALAGLFVPFVQQGCPGSLPCLMLKLFLPHTSLAAGQDGPILVAVVPVALLLGLVAVARFSTPLLVAKLVLSLATLAVAALDAVDPTRVLNMPIPYSHLLVLAPGFLVVIIGSALGSFLALLTLALGTVQRPAQRLPASQAPA
jgi:hypothetical protein